MDNVRDPKLEHPEEVILKFTSTAICWSDLYIYNTFIPQLKDQWLGKNLWALLQVLMTP